MAKIWTVPRVYEACGFIVTKRNCIYRKQLELDSVL